MAAHVTKGVVTGLSEKIINGGISKKAKEGLWLRGLMEKNDGRNFDGFFFKPGPHIDG